MNDITIVTGIWNINRDAAGEGFKRSFDHYLSNFTTLLNALKDEKVLVYIERQYRDNIPRHPNHKIYEREVDWFKSFDFYTHVQDIRTNEKWLSQAGWLCNSTQATLELYNPLVMSKFFLLNDATIHNPFNTEYFVWLDGGITNTVHPGYFFKDDVISKLQKYLNPFLFVSFPYETGPEIHGFSRSSMNSICDTSNVSYVCRGGIFGGRKDIINEYNSYYHNLLRETLTSGLMGTEESIFTIMSYQQPHIFKRTSIAGDGLLSTFFENVKNEQIEIIPKEESLQPNNKNKISVYILTFNSPNQFKSMCESWHPALDYKSHRLILVNNSTDKTTLPTYNKLCEQYGFEHIEMEKNVGICGARQFIANHFNSSDSDYYIFLEDDMTLNPPNTELCSNGFRKYVPHLIKSVVSILQKERYDFLKFSFTEFFGDNSTQWAWYNVPQNIREKYFPNKPQLPKTGRDPDPPKTTFKNIKSYKHLAYADGEVYYCNWPQIVSKSGNKKMFLTTTWAHPFEQTWMSYMFQQNKLGNINGAVLLASPITHNRFDHYEGRLRVES